MSSIGDMTRGKVISALNLRVSPCILSKHVALARADGVQRLWLHPLVKVVVDLVLRLLGRGLLAIHPGNHQ